MFALSKCDIYLLVGGKERKKSSFENSGERNLNIVIKSVGYGQMTKDDIIGNERVRSFRSSEMWS